MSKHRFYGWTMLAALWGVMFLNLGFAINTAPSAIAPKVAGGLFDQGVGYGVTFYFLATWCFIGAVVLCFTRRPDAAISSRAAVAGT